MFAIDIDPEGNLTSTFLKGKDYSLKNVITDRFPFERIIEDTYINRLNIVPSNLDLEHLENHLIINHKSRRSL